MFELQELREKIQQQDYVSALRIIDQLEEMSKEDKINKIYSYLVILLLHLIKQEAEQRTTKSWDRSIMNSVFRVQRINKRRKAGGYYLDSQAMRELISEAYLEALREAAYEAFEGQYTWQQLSHKVNREALEIKCFECLDW